MKQVLRDMADLIKSLPELLSSALNSRMGFKEGLDYKAAIGKELNNARVLKAQRLHADEPLILDALQRSNFVLAYGLENEDQLHEVLRKGMSQ